MRADVESSAWFSIFAQVLPGGRVLAESHEGSGGCGVVENLNTAEVVKAVKVAVEISVLGKEGQGGVVVQEQLV